MPCVDTRMAKGEGKGWAKGRTAANDPRIARNAVRHRGLTYERHLRPEDDRRYASGNGPRTLPFACLRQEALREGRHPFYTLKYGNRASLRLLPTLYGDPAAPCLLRKRAIWLDYATRHALVP